ncbi:MAG: endonuclease/exonuclease/phosphatase family protein [Calditrichia bacterium]|nr:endonuclease/exonuclease/phosphatase family protein [Calditrichia bacterium]
MDITICTYNIEWFNHLFNKDNSLKTSAKAKERIKAIGNIIREINPDLLGILEAPNTSADGAESTVTKLKNFAVSENLSINQAITGFISGGTQEIAVLYNPDKLTLSHSPGGKSNSRNNPPFDKEFYFDTDEDRIKEVYKNYRPPLEVKVKELTTSKEFKLILAHPKSKGIFNNMDMLHWERESHRNRLKLFAECEWLRRRIDEFLNDNQDVIVMGDFNDGPGMDFYEFKYGRSAVEIIIGDLFEPGKILNNFTNKPKWTLSGWKPSTARFKDPITGDYVNVLIDHILASSGLLCHSFRIWNPYENDNIKHLKNDFKSASDHFPVSVKIQL